MRRDIDTISRLEIWFVILTSVIFLVGYFVYASSMNVFQSYAYQYKLHLDIFPILNLRSSRVVVLLLGLGLLKQLQVLERQRVMMLILLFLLSMILTLCKFVDFSLFMGKVQLPFAYYSTVFLEGALASTLTTLSISLVGERLRFQGVFRAFALSNVFCFAGISVCSRIEALFASSFGLYNLGMGILNLVLVTLLCYLGFSRRFGKEAH